MGARNSRRIQTACYLRTWRQGDRWTGGVRTYATRGRAKMRHHVTGIACLIMVMGYLTAMETPAQTRWKFSTSYPADNFHTQNIQRFSEEVDAATQGALKIEVFPNGTLIKQKEIVEGVKTGKAAGGEVILSSMSSLNPVFGIDSVPFLLTSYPDALKLWEYSRPYIVKALNEQGLKLLFSVPWPPQGLYATKPIQRMNDLRNTRIRTYNAATKQIAELAHAKSVEISAADLPTALANHEVDVVLTSAATGLDIKAWETVKFFHPVNAWIPKNIVLISQKAFNNLTASQQTKVMALAKIAEERGWKLSEEKNKQFQADLIAKGTKLIEPTAFLRTDFFQAGEKLTREWLRTAGPEGLAILLQYETTRFERK